VGRYTSLQLTNIYTPIISYYDYDNQHLKLAVCHDIACTNPTITRVDSEGNVGLYSSLALTSDGYPVISFFEGYPPGNLKVAIFEKPLANHTLTVGVMPQASAGTVTSEPAGIDCGATCTADFLEGTLVTLTATPATGYTFAGWSGVCGGTSACQVTMDMAKSVSAIFNIEESNHFIYLPLTTR
jgi:hypothetical protein